MRAKLKAGTPTSTTTATPTTSATAACFTDTVSVQQVIQGRAEGFAKTMTASHIRNIQWAGR